VIHDGVLVVRPMCAELLLALDLGFDIRIRKLGRHDRMRLRRVRVPIRGGTGVLDHLIHSLFFNLL
jgi:hypothetical protein